MRVLGGDTKRVFVASHSWPIYRGGARLAESGRELSYMPVSKPPGHADFEQEYTKSQ